MLAQAFTGLLLTAVVPLDLHAQFDIVAPNQDPHAARMLEHRRLGESLKENTAASPTEGFLYLAPGCRTALHTNTKFKGNS